jgi:murein DD-endopeptidase MepM/ murein hydrolase activator NlpD
MGFLRLFPKKRLVPLLCTVPVLALGLVLFLSGGLPLPHRNSAGTETAQVEPTPLEAAPEPAEAEPPTAIPATIDQPKAALKAVLVPDIAQPGEPLAVALALPDILNGEGSPRDRAEVAMRGVTAALFNSQDKLLSQGKFFPLESPASDTKERTLWAALLAVPSTVGAQTGYIRIQGLPENLPGQQEIGKIPFVIKDRDFTSEVIDLDQRNTEIRTVPDPQKTRETEELWNILSRTGREIYAEEAFVSPVTGTRRTSFYGDRRVFRYVSGSTDTSIHAGIDYGVGRGAPVSACAPGKVLLARPRIVTGNSVIIEHLPAVYSLYYHLDSIAVAEGDMVVPGTLLGESGSTGLATGPHLHWEIRVSGENTDPDACMARPLLDKQAILDKLNDNWSISKGYKL